MAKLQLPDDRQTIQWLIFDRMLGLKRKPLIIPKAIKGDPRRVSHQLQLQGVADDESVRKSVYALIDAGIIVTSEPEWVDVTQENPRLTSDVLLGHVAV